MWFPEFWDPHVCKRICLSSRGRFPVLLFPTPWTCWGHRAGSCHVHQWPSHLYIRLHLLCPLLLGCHLFSTKRQLEWLLLSQQHPLSHRHPSHRRDKHQLRHRVPFLTRRRHKARPRGRLRHRLKSRHSLRPLFSPSLCQPRSRLSSSQHLCKRSHLALQ